MELEVLSSGCYRERQKKVQRCSGVCLALAVSGVEYMHISFPSGVGLAEDGNGRLSLLPSGFFIDFSFNDLRENYVINCRMPGLSWCENERFLHLKHRDEVLRMPYSIAVPPEKLELLRKKFIRVNALLAEPVPSRSFAAEMETSAILSELVMAADCEITVRNGVGEKLKSLIDADTGFQHSLEDLSRDMGYSAAHARRLFTATFGIDPREYRARLRLFRIRNLLEQCDESPKEIAADVGMRNVTHLYAFLKQRGSLPPRQLREIYRSGAKKPEQTLYGAIFREIATKEQPRIVKAEQKGKFRRA